MKLDYKLYIFFFILISLNACEKGFSTNQTIKIISYNILDGFNYGKNIERKNDVSTWLQNQLPDIVAYQELCNFNQVKLLEFAKTYRHDYADIVKIEGYPVGITSNKPILTISKNIDGFGHGLLHVKTYNIDFLIIHLSPHDRIKRKNEAQNVINYIKSQNLTDFVLLGDFNAISPFDAVNIESNLYFTDYLINSGKEKNRNNFHNDNLDYSVISLFLSFDLNDICHKFVKNNRSTFPTKINCQNNHNQNLYESNNLSRRIDYIFVSDNIYNICISAKIHNNEENDYLSDHYPVEVIIEK